MITASLAEQVDVRSVDPLVWGDPECVHQACCRGRSIAFGLIRPEDVFVNVLEAAKENWSVGHGLAQFA